MYVGTVMQTELITVSPATSLSEAQSILDRKQVNHLLVVDEKKELLGIVSDRDLKRHWASAATTLSRNELNYLLDQITVSSIMTKKTISVSLGTTIERAAHIMQQNRINALPVFDGDALVGIITSRDVMKILLEAIGMGKESARITLLVRDRMGVIAQVTGVLKDAGVNIRSFFAWPEKAHPGIYQLVLRTPADLKPKAVAALTSHGFKVLTEFVKDLTPYLPE
ncbi:MAG: CBS and ACT domain-containing protein [Desulfobacterales bacterium]